MKTTLNIDDTVMAELKREAARRRTISKLVEIALRDAEAPKTGRVNPAARRPADKNTPAEKWVGVPNPGASPKTHHSVAAGVKVAGGGGTLHLHLLIIGGVLYRGSIDRMIYEPGTDARSPKWAKSLGDLSRVG